MAATDGGASLSATPGDLSATPGRQAWPGALSRHIKGVWRLTPPAPGSSVVPETLQICFRNRGDGSVACVAELAVMASGQRLESVDLECVSRAHDPPCARNEAEACTLVLKQSRV